MLRSLQQSVYKARQFRFKPDGDVTVRFFRDQLGQPVNTMQSPTVYPLGELYIRSGRRISVYPYFSSMQLLVRHAIDAVCCALL